MPSVVAPDRNWTADRMPDQSGRCAVITGANNGLGREAARALAARGAEVVIACRDTAKGEEAVGAIRAEVPGARLETVELDLASLDSVRTAARRLRDHRSRIDLLINNAGVMTPPLGRTAEGFEQQFGVNHLAHFAFTGLLLDRILAAGDPRIVTVSSVAHRRGGLDFDDLHWRTRRYDRVAAYGQSKLANLMFAYELQRRLQAAGERPCPQPRTRASRVPDCSGTTLPWCGRRWDPRSGPSTSGSPRPPSAACSRCCTRQPRPTFAAAATTVRPDSGSSPARRSSPTPTAAPTTPPRSGACGRFPKS